MHPPQKSVLRAPSLNGPGPEAPPREEPAESTVSDGPGPEGPAQSTASVGDPGVEGARWWWRVGARGPRRPAADARIEPDCHLAHSANAGVRRAAQCCFGSRHSIVMRACDCQVHCLSPHPAFVSTTRTPLPLPFESHRQCSPVLVPPQSIPLLCKILGYSSCKQSPQNIVMLNMCDMFQTGCLSSGGQQAREQHFALLCLCMHGCAFST